MRQTLWTASRRTAASSEPELPQGALTGVPLHDVRRLCLPHIPGAFGHLRPPLDHTALQLSLELAYMTYTLELEPWKRAGWRDLSIQVDNRLESGMTVGESESAASDHVRALINGWKLTRARMALKDLNPISQMMSALRQREKSDTIKAVTMLHPAQRGRFVVAIGFMGTGSRFYDWFSNFRFTTEDGFHKGFYQLMQTFEQSVEHIRFPDTAAALGLETLTLGDVLREMRTPDSRFTLWMAGHSQGAAVMQVFCHRLLTVWGVQPAHIVGYGFASPTTAQATVATPAAYPLYHVINTDDLVPRIGAITHLGLLLRYQANGPLREATYGWNDDPAVAELRDRAESIFAHIEDTPTMLETLVAFLHTVVEEKTEDSLNALMEKRWSIAPLDRAFTFAGHKTREMLERMARYSRVAYWSLTGHRMNESTVTALEDDMRPTVRDVPLRRLMGALGERYHPPHMLNRANQGIGAYGYIVLHGYALLTPCVWKRRPDAEPVCVRADAYAVFAPGMAVDHAPVRTRRRPLRRAAKRSPRSLGISTRRAEWKGRAPTPRVLAALPRRRAVRKARLMLRFRHGRRPHQPKD